MKKNNYKLTTAFTLIELMITIAIIAIIILSLNNIDFNKMSSNQRLDMFTNSIITNIENIRNNALLGRGVKKELQHPDKWVINYSSDEINTQYSISGNLQDYSSIAFPNNFKIKKMECLDFNNSIDNTLLSTDIATIEFDGIKIIITGGCDSTITKKLKFFTTNSIKERVITFNSINGLIEVK